MYVDTKATTGMILLTHLFYTSLLDVTDDSTKEVSTRRDSQFKIRENTEIHWKLR